MRLGRDERRHEGKVVVITGSSAGIGRGAAEVFAADGASVVVHGLDAAEVDGVVRGIREAGGAACGVAGDVTREETHEAIVTAALETFGRLDHLVTSAGIQTYGDAATTTPAEFDRVFAVNVRAPFFIVQQGLRRLRDGGRIINISSGAARLAMPEIIAYGASKGALDTFTLNLAKELGPRGITVNIVEPGPVDHTRIADVFDEEHKQRQAAATPLGRLANPADVAQAVAFYAAEDNAFMTGTTAAVNGGMSMY